MKFERFEHRKALDILTADIIRHADAIERFERRRLAAAADIALYLVAVLAVIVVCWIA